MRLKEMLLQVTDVGVGALAEKTPHGFFDRVRDKMVLEVAALLEHLVAPLY